MKRILVSGYYGFKNLGDELILSKIIEDVQAVDPNFEIQVVSGNPGYTQKIHGVKGINRFSPSEVVEGIRSADLVIVGGGGLIHEYFSLDITDIFTSFGYNVPFYAVTPLIAKIFQKPVFYWGHGVGPIFTEEGRKFTRWFYSLADFTTLRDQRSFEILREICGHIDKVYIDQDPGLHLKVKSLIRPVSVDFPGNKVKIGFNFRPWFGIEDLLKNIAAAFQALYRMDRNIVFVPIPFDLSLDHEILKQLAAKLPEESCFSYEHQNLETPGEIISIMSHLDFFVGMRLHAVIVSRLLKIPTLPISYDLKTDEASRFLNLDSIRVEDLTKENFLSGMQNLLIIANRPWDSGSCAYETPRLFKEFVSGKGFSETAPPLPQNPIDNNQGRLVYENFIKSLGRELRQIRSEKESLEAQQDRSQQILSGQTKKIEELLAQQEKQEQDYKSGIAEKDRAIDGLRSQLNQTLAEKADFENRLNQIYLSDFWKVASRYYQLRNNSILFRGAYRLLKRIRSSLKARGTPETSRIISPREEKMGAGAAESGPQSAANFRKAGKTIQYDIICLPIIDWFFRFQRPQQLLTQFAKTGSLVFYIRPQFLGPGNGSFASREISENILDISITADPGLNIYKDKLDEENLTRMERSFEDLRREMGMVEAVILVQLPFWQPLAKRLKERFGWKIVYDCLDEHSGFSTNEKAMLSQEEALARESDLVVATAGILYEKMKGYNEKCVWIPNAADFEHFRKLPPNDLLRDTPKPIIGYYGAISDWFDEELVEFLAQNREDWNFVLIGHTFGANISKLQSLPNVHFLGEKPYNELPKYLYWFDVGIIPFKLGRLIAATNPVKFYEFMSAGQKVVSVEIPELIPFSRYLYLAKDKNEFLNKIELALQENDVGLVSERIQLAQKNTWEERHRVLREEIRRIYPKASIILITQNNLSFTKFCLESVFAKSQYPHLEVILVDNHSADGTKEYLRDLAKSRPDVQVIFNEKDEGFFRGNLQGVRASSGEYIVFLHNQTVVSRGWLSRLFRHLRREGVGIVGTVTNCSGDEAGIDLPCQNRERMEELAEDYLQKHMEPTGFETEGLTMFCVAIKRDVLKEVGGFDQSAGTGLFADDNLSRRVRSKGYRVFCAQDVFIRRFCSPHK